MPFLRKYNTLTVTGTTAIRIPIIKRAVVDFAVSADWTPAAGDVKIAIDGAAAANVTNLPTAVAMGNGAYWEFILTAAELTCKSCIVTVADSATKAVEDQSFIVETFGHASAMYPPDFTDAVRLGLTALPNAAADAAGGLPISDAGGLDLDSKLANTNEVTAARMGALTDWINGGRLDLILDARSSQTSVDDLPTNAELATALGTLNNLSASQVNAEVLDVLDVDTFAEETSIPAATASLRKKIGWMFMWFRNKVTQTGTTSTLFADDGTTVVGTHTVSDDATTFTSGEGA